MTTVVIAIAVYFALKGVSYLSFLAEEISNIFGVEK
jgi:hypothetical protein